MRAPRATQWSVGGSREDGPGPPPGPPPRTISESAPCGRLPWADGLFRDVNQTHFQVAVDLCEPRPTASWRMFHRRLCVERPLPDDLPVAEPGLETRASRAREFHLIGRKERREPGAVDHWSSDPPAGVDNVLLRHRERQIHDDKPRVIADLSIPLDSRDGVQVRALRVRGDRAVRWIRDAETD